MKTVLYYGQIDKFNLAFSDVLYLFIIIVQQCYTCYTARLIVFSFFNYFIKLFQRYTFF